MAAIGFIGTGLMGRPMVERLIEAGHKVHIWNRTAGKALPLRDQGAIIEPSPAAVADNSELLALCLTDGAAVGEALFGVDGIVGAGHVPPIVDFTSMAPRDAVAIAGKLGQRGINYVDAPVSGGVPGAMAGTLVVMCGGDAGDVAKLKPIFDAIAARVTLMGPAGAGQVTKLCNQHIVAASVIAMAEAFALARNTGIDTTRIPEALAGGFADSKAFQLWGKRMAAGSWTPNVGAVDTMRKDVRNVVEAMADTTNKYPLARSLQQIFDAISADGRGSEDIGSIESYFTQS